MPSLPLKTYTYYSVTDISKNIKIKLSNLSFDYNYFLSKYSLKKRELNELLERNILKIDSDKKKNLIRMKLCVNKEYEYVIESGYEKNKIIEFPVLYSEIGYDSCIEIEIWYNVSVFYVIKLFHVKFDLFTDSGVLKVGNYLIDFDDTEDYLFSDNIEYIRNRKNDDWLNELLKKRIEVKKNEVQRGIEISLPVFEHSVVDPIVFKHFLNEQNNKGSNGNNQNNDNSSGNNNETIDEIIDIRKKDYIVIFDINDDQSNNNTNPVENKNFKLSTHQLDDNIDIKPNTQDLKKIQTIINLTSLDQINYQQKYHLWKFRNYLLNNNKVLVKFLKSVSWEDKKESSQALSLIHKWSDIDYIDALELLSYYFKNVKEVREYAVKHLSKLDDNIILEILLQLVQALRYDNASNNEENVYKEEGSLCLLLIKRACNNFEIANFLYWHLTTEIKNDNKYEKIRHIFTLELLKNKKVFFDRLEQQKKFVEEIRNVRKRINKVGRLEKIKKLKEELTNNPVYDELFKKGINNLVSPNQVLNGFLVDELYVYKSNLNPFLIPCKVLNTRSDSEEITRMIYKTGNDLRQGQLVIQIIKLMDNILKRNAIDLKLTAFEILPCSTFDGFVKCIYPSESLHDIFYIQKKTICSWLKEKNPVEENYKIACDNFVRSCAGYCVITYILGIGDRHLENILLRETGEMFHIDFDYILGRDPKPYPPLMKLSPEMVKALKNMNISNKVSKDNGYNLFVEFCCTAYNVLRKHANLILNLFVLMLDSNIPDLKRRKNTNYHQTKINKIKEKFKLNYSDNEAILSIRNIIEDSEKALFSKINDVIHRYAQYWRE